IRRALLDLTQEGLLHRVPGSGTYVQRTKRGRVQVIVLLCTFLHWYMTDIIDGSESVVGAEGYELSVRNSSQRADVEARHIQEVMEMSVSGIILWPRGSEFSKSPSNAVRSLLRGTVPAVVV